MRKSLSPLRLALALTFAAACGGQLDDQGLQGQLDADEVPDMVFGKTNLPGPATLPGSLYKLQSSTAIGAITVLRLGPDRSFHRETIVVCAAAPCAPLQLDGNYVLTRSAAGTTYVRFMHNGQSIDRFAYTLHGNALQLSNVATQQAFQMHREAILGEHCGGINGLACTQGLSCALTTSQPDTGGTCR